MLTVAEQALFDVTLAHVAHQVHAAPAMATAEAAFLDAWRATVALLRPAGHGELTRDLETAFDAAVAEAVRQTLRAALCFDGGALLWSGARRETLRAIQEVGNP